MVPGSFLPHGCCSQPFGPFSFCQKQRARLWMRSTLSCKYSQRKRVLSSQCANYCVLAGIRKIEGNSSQANQMVMSSRKMQRYSQRINTSMLDVLFHYFKSTALIFNHQECLVVSLKLHMKHYYTHDSAAPSHLPANVEDAPMHTHTIRVSSLLVVLREILIHYKPQ